MNPPIRNYSCLLLFLVSNFLHAQSTITGKVVDTIMKPIVSSNIFLKNKETNAIVAFTYTTQQGIYVLKTDVIGEFVLNFSALGYTTENVVVTLKENEIIEKDLVLKPRLYDLDEVIITSERAITEKKDTIVFNAAAFKQGEETVVEDLLKKLPGVQVSETGTIKIDGREVEKVMIEGDDFFKKGYKLLTKNLDVAAVDKVEVLRRYSNNKLLTGIEASEKVALNLKLDEAFKRQWFGTISPGYGVASENRYDTDVNVSNFGKKNKYFLLGSLNNIGEDVTEDVQGLIDANNYSNEPGIVGEHQRAYALINLEKEVLAIKKSQTNFNNAELLSMNSIVKLSDELNIKLLGLFNSDDNDFFRKGFETFFVTDSNFTNTENYSLSKNTRLGFGRIEMAYDMSDTKVLEYEGKYNKAFVQTSSNILFNDQNNNEHLQNNNVLQDHMIKFSNRLNSTSVLLLTSRFIKEEKSQEYATNLFLFSRLFPLVQEVNTIGQLSTNKLTYIGSKAQLLNRRKNKDLLDVSIGYEFREDNLFSDLFLKENELVLDISETYRNKLSYKTHDLYLNSGYTKKIKEELDIAINVEAHQLFNRLDESNQKKKQSSFLLNSKLNCNWQIDKSNTFFVYVENVNSNATVSDVYSNYLLTGYKDFSRGTGTLNSLNTTKVLVGYNIGNFGDRFIANMSLSYTKDNDFFSTNSLIEENFTQTTKLLIPNRLFYNAVGTLDRYIKRIKNNIKCKFKYSKIESKNIVNAMDFREVENHNYQYGVEIRSGFRGVFNYHFGTTWDTTQINSRVQNSTTQNVSFVDISFIFTSKLTLQLQSERYFFSNLGSANDTYYFANFEVNYKLKNKNLSFAFIGNNLFNTEVFRNYSVNDINISNTEYALVSKYLLLKARYKF